MAETVWYYARGDVERGPFTTVQIKALANAGKLRGDDLVWREGMENWTSASDVAELFSPERPSPDKPSPNPFGYEPPTTVRLPTAERASRETQYGAVFTGRAFLFTGLLCVVLMRGCESLGERRLKQVQATANSVAALRQDGQFSTETGSSEIVDPNAGRSPEVIQAEAAYRSGAFARGVALCVGVLFTLLGGAILAVLATGPDRWLGIAIVVVVCLASLRFES